MAQLLTLALSDDPASIVGCILLFGSIIWVLVIVATSEPSESAKRQYQIDHLKTLEGDKPEERDKPPAPDT